MKFKLTIVAFSLLCFLPFVGCRSVEYSSDIQADHQVKEFKLTSTFLDSEMANLDIQTDHGSVKIGQWNESPDEEALQVISDTVSDSVKKAVEAALGK